MEYSSNGDRQRSQDVEAERERRRAEFVQAEGLNVIDLGTTELDTSGIEELVREPWSALNLDVSLSIDAVTSAFSTPELMLMRGALRSTQDMMDGGMADLFGAMGATGEDRMRAMLSVWTLGGRLTVSTLIDIIDASLEERGVPVVSLVEVESSNLAALGWADDQAVVLFQNGGLYAYAGVPEEVFQEWWEAPSRGVFLSERIKDKYEYMKVL